MTNPTRPSTPEPDRRSELDKTNDFVDAVNRGTEDLLHGLLGPECECGHRRALHTNGRGSCSCGKCGYFKVRAAGFRKEDAYV